MCAMCHGEADLWEGDKLRLYVSKESLANDIHLLKGVNCHDCHGGNPGTPDVPEAHSTEASKDDPKLIPFRFPLSAVWKSCSNCHKDQADGLTQGVHAQKGGKHGPGNAKPTTCAECHGAKAHGMVAVEDSRSPVFLDHQVKLCGNCHLNELSEYENSVHGRGLTQSGLLVTAVCADCHGAHAIHPPSDERSTLHATHVADTCAKCHAFIEERLQKSVHGRDRGLGAVSKKAAPGGKVKRKPSCTDCHQGHDLPDPRTLRFRTALPDRCGNCHSELVEEYRMSLHGSLTELGHVRAAKCSDCHGAHDILPIDDPQSRLAAGNNRLKTCGKCHPNATRNFCNFQPHADYQDAKRYPVLNAVYVSMELLIYSVFAFFGVHAVLWLIRSLIHYTRHGRPSKLVPGTVAYVRFETVHRIVHAIVIVSFLGLALTGLPLRFSNQAWAQTLARALGGFDSTSLWHHILGVVTFGYFAGHVIWLVRRAIQRALQGAHWKTILFGPDSPVPNARDFVDMFRMFRWFLGLGPRPSFERWTYWEKFDYWAVFWGVAIIGTSGLMLWFPNLFSRFLPGEVLNVAKVVHSEEALLATSFIFAIHFFGTHLRPEKFPMDLSVLSGLVTEDELRDERPEFLERMRRDGRLDMLKATVPSRRVLLLIVLAGSLALLVGLGLLVGMMSAIAH